MHTKPAATCRREDLRGKAGPPLGMRTDLADTFMTKLNNMIEKAGFYKEHLQALMDP